MAAMSTSSGPGPRTAADRAYEFAKWAILTGVFAADEVVTEEALAHEVGLGRTPAREALLRLEAEGLVGVVAGRGAVVSDFSTTDAEEVLEARHLVESHVADRSFAHRAALLPQVEAAYATMRRTHRERDAAAFSAADRDFHELIVEAAGNAVLSSMYRMLRDRQTLFSSMILRGRSDRMEAAIDGHARILAALRGDDREAFRAALDDHLRWSVRLVQEPR